MRTLASADPASLDGFPLSTVSSPAGACKMQIPREFRSADFLSRWFSFAIALNR
jgi:hypothetical protein